MSQITSWGKVKKVAPQLSIPNAIREIEFISGKPNLAVGLRRSYSDTCLLEDGQLIDTTRLCKFISFDRDKGIIEAEAGISFADILEVIIPAGWFLPATPGTQFVTLGGAIANDVHGKNHHLVGAIGNYIKSLVLFRSDKGDIICNDLDNGDLFRATIGGLGLTGVIKSAKIQLIPIKSSFLSTETIQFQNLDEFFIISDSSKDWPYTVAWVDCLASGKDLGRGLFSRGKFCEDGGLEYINPYGKISIPIEMPSFLLNKFSVKLFNAVYYNKQGKQIVKETQSYNKFFYPLDKIQNWNRLYGMQGFYQYQCAIPNNVRKDALSEMLNIIAKSGQGSFLAVLKTFGNIKSPGLISFPVEGVTLALDFQNKPGVLELFSRLDDIVNKAGGVLYPAKDGRIPAEMFKSSYPNWQRLEALRDPAINSLFWQKLTGDRL